MLRMLIVDDERVTREALFTLVDWQKLGIEHIELCKNGAEAFDRMIDDYPDIILTDIKMPGLSGLDLIARAHAARMNTIFIVLSGYAEFEFAKEAMHYGVRHYLLKPVSREQLQSVMEEVCAECLSRIASEGKHVSAPSSTGDLVRVIKTYVRDNLSDSSLSLKKLSEETLFMNPDYVSKLFGKKTGERFSAYVSRKRIEMAKALLKSNPDIRVQEIAERTGFGNDVQYFFRMFKKATGYTPSDYIRLQSQENP